MTITIHNGEPDRDELITLIARAVNNGDDLDRLHPDDREDQIAIAIDVLDALREAGLHVVAAAQTEAA